MTTIKKYSYSIMIFRRDLRLFDNIALIESSKLSKKIIPCFIIDPEQVTEKNSYRSLNAVQYMIESLYDLVDELKKAGGKLYIFYGNPIKIIENLYNHITIDAIFINRDYTPYAKKRDSDLNHFCIKHKLAYHSYNDSLLNAPENIVSQKKTPYTVFTPFFKAALDNPIMPVNYYHADNYYTNDLLQEYDLNTLKINKNHSLFIHGGRRSGLEILSNLTDFKHYELSKDMPHDKTTGLSAHNKFGTLSIREVYYAIKKALGTNHPLIRQLYWRDFFTYIAEHFPRVFNGPFIEKYNNLIWKNDPISFNAWCMGNTGFPIVDAGMRQLNITGWMHNRVRMIVASFLTKDLHIDWRWGERYFAQQLVDYDPCVNNGNWQWAASIGCDAQPYFRIFNPWLQQKKFDPACIYIKKWVPELKNISPDSIHHLYNTKMVIRGYNKPIVNHAEQSEYAKKMFLKN